MQRRGGAWRVRWQDHAGRWCSRTFARKTDATAFEAEVKRAKRLGGLAALQADRMTVDELMAGVWAPARARTLAARTLASYQHLYDRHVSPHLGGMPAARVTPAVVSRWQADLLAAGVGARSAQLAAAVLSAVMQAAVEADMLARNPVRLARKAPAARRREVRALGPIEVERLRRAIGARLDVQVPAAAAGARPRRGYLQPDTREPTIRQRDMTLVALLALAGLRPGEALALRWADIGENTILVQRATDLDGAIKHTKTRQGRSVRLLRPLAGDLRAWRLASGRPDDEALLFPAADGRAWPEARYKAWAQRSFRRAARAAGVPHATPYTLRHSFASLLLAEGRSVIDVAAQLGHSPQMTLSVYAHVIAELDGAPRIDAEQAVTAARRRLADEAAL